MSLPVDSCFMFCMSENTHLVVSYIINIIKHYLYLSTYRSLINFVSEDQQGTQNASTPLIIQILLRNMLDFSPSFTWIKYHKYMHIIAREMAVGMKTSFSFIYICFLVKEVVLKVWYSMYSVVSITAVKWEWFILPFCHLPRRKFSMKIVLANCCDEDIQVQ